MSPSAPRPAARTRRLGALPAAGAPAVPAPRAEEALPAPTPARGRRSRARTTPSVPLGSLTQREHQHVISCKGCGSTRVTRLSLNLTDGTPVEFTSCHHCEHRTWEHAGDEMAVTAVLDHAKKE